MASNKQVFLSSFRRLARCLQNCEDWTNPIPLALRYLSEALKGEVYLFSPEGKSFDKTIPDLTEEEAERYLPVLSTQEDANREVYGWEKPGFLMITPLLCCKMRLGTLLISREKKPFQINDIVLAEYAGSIIALTLSRQREVALQEEARGRGAAESAVSTLTSSEHFAVRKILESINYRTGTMVAGDVADREGFTRSVAVTGLRKLESAGVVESHSIGNKGTCIEVKNTWLQEVLNKKSRK